MSEQSSEVSNHREVVETVGLETKKSAYIAWRLLLALAIFLASMLITSNAQPIYDAARYLGGAQGLFSEIQGVSTNLQMAGGLHLRGVYTPFVYLPAVALGSLFDDPTRVFLFIRCQNAILLSLLGVWLIPRLVRDRDDRSVLALVVSGLLVVLLFARFVPYALMDLPALFLIILSLVFVKQSFEGRPWVWLVVSGLSAGIAFNLRPAYLLPIVAISIWVLFMQRARALGFVGALIGSLLPQYWLNRMIFDQGGLLPVSSSNLSGAQSGWAAYVVRYDTLREPGEGGYMFCAPQLASKVASLSNDDRAIQGPGDLLIFLVTNLPQTILFVLQKISLNLWWPVSAPYYESDGALDVISGILCVAVFVVGCYGLFRLSRNADLSYKRRFAALLIVILALLLATIISSAAETRFSLPVLVLAVSGTVTLVKSGVAVPEGGIGKNAGTYSLLLFGIVLVSALAITAETYPVDLSEAPTPEACLESVQN